MQRRRRGHCTGLTCSGQQHRQQQRLCPQPCFGGGVGVDGKTGVAAGVGAGPCGAQAAAASWASRRGGCYEDAWAICWPRQPGQPGGGRCAQAQSSRCRECLIRFVTASANCRLKARVRATPPHTTAGSTAGRGPGRHGRPASGIGAPRWGGFGAQFYARGGEALCVLSEGSSPRAVYWLTYLKDIEGAAVNRQFDPYLTAGCVCAAAPLWYVMGCCSSTG